MFHTLPADARAALAWPWEQFAPYFADLESRPLTGETLAAWLADWSQLHRLISEVGTRLSLAHNLDTTDADAQAAFFSFVENIYPPAATADQKLKQKLVASGLEPKGMAIPLRNLRAEAELFRQENLPLFTQLQKHISHYDTLMGAQTVEWDGQETPLPQLRPWLNHPERAVREKAWRLAHQRRLADREALNQLWQTMLGLRRQIATQADCPDFRAYSWRAYLRFDYTPADALTFLEAIEQVCTPAATRLYRRCQHRLGLATLRPWDLSDGAWNRPADPPGLSPLQPYHDGADLVRKTTHLFNRLDPQLGAYFQTLADENLLDVDNRKGKAPGGYCTYFATARRPFIFMNAVGLHDDVQTMLHEAGHAFHALAHSHLPYHPQYDVPMEFNEVASMAMELLAGPYLTADSHGFYTPAEAARAQREHLEQMLLFWPYMATVDSFQHWAYTHPDQAADSAACDAQWGSLSERFMPALDWSGLDAELVTGWQRKQHIFQVPFYYIEYGLAAVGAAQVWRNMHHDPAQALARYRQALALGGTRSLPELYAAAGVRFAFDATTLQEIVSLIETTLTALEEPTQTAAGAATG